MKNRPGIGSIATIGAAVALIWTPPALAQNANTYAAAVTPPQSWQNSDAEKIKELQQRLDQRDALIRDLLQRVQRLERMEAARSGGSAAAGTGQSVAAAAAARPARSVQSAAAQDPPPPQDPPPAQQQKPAAGGAAKPAPGTFEVSEEAAQHALERALVQTGASLLTPGKFEFIPSLTYQYNERTVPAQVALATNGAVLVTENVSRSTQVEANALLRVGLPWDMQLELGLPYDYKRLTSRVRVLGTGLSEQDNNVFGYGDPTITVTKQLWGEGDVWPGLFLSGSWNSNYGQRKKNVALGTGFNEFSAGITAVKRQDPLVFTAGFSYQTSLEHNSIQPGDQYTPSVGLLLAVSPETSLRFAQQLTYSRRTEVGGVPIPGSGQRSGVFTLGMLSILGRGLVMDFSTSIGETPDAPDLSIRLAFPIRLN